MSAKFSLINKTQTTPLGVAFRAIKNAILGPEYTLTLIFVQPQEIAKLNLIYRNKKEPTDILSFPLSKTEGEIYICPSVSRTEAKKFDRTYKNFIAFIFIHGCVHLIGHDHGSTMESIEARFRKKFRI